MLPGNHLITSLHWLLAHCIFQPQYLTTLYISRYCQGFLFPPSHPRPSCSAQLWSASLTNFNQWHLGRTKTASPFPAVTLGLIKRLVVCRHRNSSSPVTLEGMDRKNGNGGFLQNSSTLLVNNRQLQNICHSLREFLAEEVVSRPIFSSTF